MIRKRYATINKQLDLFEEAEFGFWKAVEFGDHELDTWLFCYILQFLGEFESIQTLCKPLWIILKKMKSNTV
jgi:hypothetical protein